MHVCMYVCAWTGNSWEAGTAPRLTQSRCRPDLRRRLFTYLSHVPQISLWRHHSADDVVGRPCIHRQGAARYFEIYYLRRSLAWVMFWPPLVCLSVCERNRWLSWRLVLFSGHQHRPALDDVITVGLWCGRRPEAAGVRRAAWVGARVTWHDVTAASAVRRPVGENAPASRGPVADQSRRGAEVPRGWGRGQGGRSLRRSAGTRLQAVRGRASSWRPGLKTASMIRNWDTCRLLATLSITE